MRIGEDYSTFMMFTGSFIPNLLLVRKDLTLCDKVVFARLSQYAGMDGICYPKQIDIANEIGCSLTAVRTAIKHLVEMKLIRIIKPTGSERLRHLHDKYVFIWSAIFEECRSVGKRHSGMSENDTPMKESHIKESHIISGISLTSKTGQRCPVGTAQKLVRGEPRSYQLFHKIINGNQSNEAEDVAYDFFMEFKKVRGADHPPVNDNQLKAGLIVISEFMLDPENTFTYEETDDVINQHFTKEYYHQQGFDFKWSLFVSNIETFSRRFPKGRI